MDTLADLLHELKQSGLAKGHFLGFLHVIIGRRLTKKNGTVITSGVTWRELAQQLKKARWEPDAVKELGLNPDDLPPRDRERYWYTAIIRAHVDSPEAQAAGDKFAAVLKRKGYEVGPPPGAK
jgi:hypothetical protein